MSGEKIKEYHTRDYMTTSYDRILFRSNEQPFGKTWEEWTTKWWQWFLSIPKENSPAYDAKGQKSDIGQSDPNVWFLASTTGGRAERIIRIPSGRAVLFPVINATTSYAENPALKTEADMMSFIQSDVEDIVKKQANIDGENIIISQDFRVQTPPFDFSYPPNNIYGAREGPTRGVGDGYWIFLKPLKEGKHVINTYGACLSGIVQIGMKIQLIVEGR